MLIKITTRCSMGCSHCMEDARPDGDDMTLEMFDQALDLCSWLEPVQTLGYNLVLLSGGEPSEHPHLVTMLKGAKRRGFQPILVTNGMWLADEERRDAILEAAKLVQVTNDPRFYPEAPPRVEHPAVSYENSLSTTLPLGRFAGKQHDEVPERQSPCCFNLRSVTRSYGDVRTALALLRARSAFALTGTCTPSICVDGTLVPGETRFCRPIGDVNSTAEDITRELCNMTCDRCGLVEKLGLEHRRAVNESVLYGPGE